MTGAPDDEELMRQISLTGDLRAYEELVRRRTGYAVRFATRLLNDRTMAEDMAQEAFIRVWQHAPEWQPSGKFTTWLYQIIYRLCIDTLRKRKPSDSAEEVMLVDEDSVSSDKQLAAKQEQMVIHKAIANLPNRQRAAITLFYYEDYSQKEVSAIMGETEKSVESLLYRARKTLSGTLGGLLDNQ